MNPALEKKTDLDPTPKKNRILIRQQEKIGNGTKRRCDIPLRYMMMYILHIKHYSFFMIQDFIKYKNTPIGFASSALTPYEGAEKA